MRMGGDTSVQDVSHGVWHGDVMLLTLDTPEACALDAKAREMVVDALTSQPLPRAMVIAIKAPGARASGPVEADVHAPHLMQVIEALVAAPFPVIIAVTGALSGPAVELALGADVILAGPDARFCLPDIALGLIPAGGATQLLPRRIGAKAALDMLLTGRVVSVSDAQQMGLVDRVVHGEVHDAALVAAAELARHPRPRRPTPGLDAKTFGPQISAARSALFVNGLPAAERMIDAVEAALILPLAQGMTMEATLREDLLQSDEVLGLRAAETAALIARRLPKSLAGIPAAPVTHLYVEGMSPATTPIVFAALSAGISVTLAEADRDVLGRVLKAIAERQDAAVSAGRLDLAARDADWARLATVTPGPLLPEGVDAMLFGPGQIARVTETATQVSSAVPRLVIDGAAGFFGLTLAPSGRITTLSGIAAIPAAATARAFLSRIGLPLIAVGGEGPSPGATIAAAGKTALSRLLTRGVREEAVLGALASVKAAKPTLPVGGFDPRANGGRPLVMPRPEIIARWWSAMAAAGMDCLAAGTALCPADIDHLMVAGYGFPRRMGGPMHMAHRRGLLLFRQDLRLWARDDRIWAPPPLLDLLLSEARTIPSLNHS